MVFKNRTKQDVKSKKTLFGKKRGDGKKRKSGVEITFNDGEKVVLLNPSGKGEKYAKELKENKRYTNGGDVKKDRDGNEMPLTNEQRAYRAAYLTALKDNAKAYKAKNGGK